MKKSRVIGGQPPPQQHVPTYKILRPHKDGELYLAILADVVTGINGHFVLSDVGAVGTTQVCTQYDPGGCKIHDNEDSWSGFIQVWDFARRVSSILRLAPKEYDEMTQRLGIDLRWQGRRVKIKPVNSGRGRCIEVVEELHGPKIPLGPFSMERTLCLVFGINRLPLQRPADEDREGVPL